MENKRRHQRILTAGTIRFSQMGGTVSLPMSLLDLSLGGMLVKAVRKQDLLKVSLGLLLKFRCYVPTGKLTGTVEVVWIGKRSACFGAKILQLDDAVSQQRLFAYVANDLIG